MRLFETTATTDHRIDEKNQRIADVVVLTAKSLNGRTYSKWALKDVARLASGARVYTDHSSSRMRSLGELAGKLSDCYVNAAGKVVGTLTIVNEKVWALVRNAARLAADSLGLSINASGETSDGGKVVDRVKVIHSVDLVALPAAVGGLFESQKGAGNERKNMSENESNGLLRKAWCESDDGAVRFAYSAPAKAARVPEGEPDEETTNLEEAWNGSDGDDW